jgi:hypothetical protein
MGWLLRNRGTNVGIVESVAVATLADFLLALKEGEAGTPRIGEMPYYFGYHEHQGMGQWYDTHVYLRL